MPGKAEWSTLNKRGTRFLLKVTAMAMFTKLATLGFKPHDLNFSGIFLLA
jgi:hypothetical protein